jgi:dTDP-glucose 4,6-dehydratase
LEEARRYFERLTPNRRQAFRFHHVSTDEVFGELGPTGKFVETTPYDPSSPYSASKAASDHLVRAWSRTFGLPVLITNCSNNYGPYQFPEKLVPLMILRALRGETLPIYGAGDNIRDWLHVEDHAAALVTVLAKAVPGSIYNVGCSAERRNLEIVQEICDLVDEFAGPLASGPRRVLIRFVTDRPGHDKRYAIDASKLGKDLGWTPIHDLAAGLRSTVQWYLSNETWWRPLIERNNPLDRIGVFASAITQRQPQEA